MWVADRVAAFRTLFMPSANRGKWSVWRLALSLPSTQEDESKKTCGVAMPPSILSIGHSNHSPDQFLALLVQHEIEALVDVRRFPGSRKHPHFHRDNLATAVQKAGVEYHWLEALGGRRNKQQDESPNLGLENISFRNYADYMLTHGFQEGVEELLKTAREKRTVILCAEGLFWRCHRRLISDFLVANGVTVQHIMPNGDVRPHKLTRGAVIEGGQVTYPGGKSLFT
jgi:uncharacterized protein (DUF488 family)